MPFLFYRTMNSEAANEKKAKFRLHPNLVKACIEGLRQIFTDGKHADSVVNNLLKSNPKWGSSDRKFIAETIYDMVRWWRKLWYLAGMEPNLTNAGLWRLCGVYFINKDMYLPAWEEFENVNPDKVVERLNNSYGIRVIRESIPDWMDDMATEELGDVWEKEITELNKQAEFVIRANTIKVSRNNLQKALRDEDTETSVIPEHPDALLVNERKRIFTTTCFQNGWFEVQDASSQEVAYFMDLKPGMRVVDACAGGGGKSLHMAALMQNKGRIISLDIFEWKLKELKRRAKRDGVSIIEARLIESSKTIKKLAESADRVLIDAPCSGIGVLKRNPDIKWKLSAESIDSIRKEQAKILSDYCVMVKKGGSITYATCSILPSENERIVDTFLSEHPNFKKVKEKRILPSESGFDGFYMAAMERGESL
jgi:16S rRNA (cytosine967-C5)-methyltransferase